MNRRWTWTGAVALAVVAALGLAPAPVSAQEKPAYTPAEYNAYKACADDTVAQTKVKCLEDFIVKFPESSLLPYAYTLGYTTYNQLKNYPKTIEFIDKLLSMGDKIDLATQLQACYLRAQVFEFAYNPRDPNAREFLTKGMDSCHMCMDVLNRFPKPENVTDEQFAQTKKAVSIQFTTTAGFAALQLKNFPAAAQELKAALALDPNLAPTWYRLGVAYLQEEPPQYEDGFWAVARAIALKIPNDAQVRAYLRQQVLRYQQTACDKEVDAQVNELITLAGSSAERPAGFHIPSQPELAKARESVATFMQTLKGGGDTAKVTWLAMCGLEFPEVGGKVFEANGTDDAVDLKVCTGATPDDIEACTEPNSEVKVLGQPRAAGFNKGDYLRFSGMLAAYTPDPFMLQWGNVKINPEDLPEEKPAPGKAPAKRPAKRPATKRPPAN